MLEGREGARALALESSEESRSVGAAEDNGRGTVARNALHLMLGQATTTALGILFGAALARTLGASDFGLYFLISSFSAFAYVLIDWGQSLYIIREVASHPERGGLFLGTALVLRSVATALALAPAGIAAWAFGYDPMTCWYSVVFVAASAPFFLAQTYGTVFRARDRMELDAWVSVINKVALLGIALPALVCGAGLPGVMAAQALAGVAALTAALRFYNRAPTGRLRYSRAAARQILLGGSAYITMCVASSIQPFIDAVILSKLAPADAVGWYGAARTILGNLIAPALIVGAASFPRLARAVANNGPVKAEIRASLRPILWLGALAAVGTYLFADDVIALLYGQHDFAPSGIILKVYAPGFFLLFTNVLFAYAVYAIDRPMAYSVLKVASVAVNTTLEFVLIPIFQERFGNGGIGVVAAFVASEVLVFGGAIFLLRHKVIAPEVWTDMARALGSAAFTLLVFWRMPALPFLVGAPVCVIAFLLCSICLGLVRRDDVQLFRALLHKKRSAQAR